MTFPNSTLESKVIRVESLHRLVTGLQT